VLTSEEAAQRLQEYGPNRIPEAAPPSWLRRVARQLASPLIYVLLFAVAFDIVTTIREGEGWPVEGTVIALVIALNTLLGVLQEYRAEDALAELKKLAAPMVWAVRDNELVHITADLIVPGDRVRIEAGERVPADGAFTEALGVMIDESVLTGESVPVEKAEGHRALSGTLVVRGKGFIDVSATGVHSAMGKLASTLERVTADRTPLEKQLAALGNRLARWVGLLALLLCVSGIVAEGLSKLEEMVLFAVAVAVAAIPEGMPAVVTLTLSLGVQRMARKNAIVRRLSAVEALGSVTVIATDKTGTLTENKMTVQELMTDTYDAALRALVLANDADDDSSAGDPLEVGLLEYARRRGVDPRALRAAHPRISLLPFDSAWKLMRVTVEEGGRHRSYLKGAPEALLGRARLDKKARQLWASRVEEAAARGQRVLAVARGDGETEEDLEWLGLVMLWDPPRAEIPEALRKAQDAGIRVLMITGDHPATAREIARRIGITDGEPVTGGELDAVGPGRLRDLVHERSVFARVSPEQKLAIVEALKASGEVVAVTGDGVNDAPALKRADVGIAMGQRGSDVAREVADLVLVDDNFATLIDAIEEGRNIFENIQTFLRFSFSTNIALVFLITAGAVTAYVEGLRTEAGNLFLPLTALQILWINFLGDGPPGLALAVDRNQGVMARPPRARGDHLLDVQSARFVLASGAFKGLVGFAALVLMPELGFALVTVQTVIFQTESLGKLFSTYTARSLTTRARRNLALHVAVLVGVALQVLSVTLPPLRNLMGLAPVGAREVLAIAAVIALAMGGQRGLAFALRHAPRPVMKQPSHSY
jgi:Ca2+-transporting ATPase